MSDQNYPYKENSIKIIKNEGEFSLSSIKEKDEILYHQYLYFLTQFSLIISPIGAVAGAFINSENTKGIWKSPANIELLKVLKPEISINDNQQDLLNFDIKDGKSINVLRNFVGRGTLIWGSRTLKNNPEYKYISIRRFVNLIETDIKNHLIKFLFESNTSSTWNQIKSSIENYLFQFWKDGALFGAKQEQAYFVKCGLDTMTEQDISEGKLMIQIGISLFKPSEFKILQFEQKMG